MTFRAIVSILVIITLSGCEKMKPTDFKDTSPRLILEEYFLGKTQAWGIFEDRFGNLRRQFVVEILGTWDGQELILDENFKYSDGERDQRIWKIKKISEHTYEGQASDVIGLAKGESYGNALNWQYDMDLKMDDGTIRVHFNDWMYLQPSGVLLNRAHVTKLGIEIGTVTLSFLKPEKFLDTTNRGFNGWQSSGESTQAENL